MVRVYVPSFWKYVSNALSRVLNVVLVTEMYESFDIFQITQDTALLRNEALVKSGGQAVSPYTATIVFTPSRSSFTPAMFTGPWCVLLFIYVINTLSRAVYVVCT